MGFQFVLGIEILRVDEVAEWLRRWTANPMGSARVGSNPILVVFFLFSFKHETSGYICFFEYWQEHFLKIEKNIPVPGIEPEPAGWEPAILTTRPYRIR